MNLVRFFGSLLQWSFLSKILVVHPLYLAATGLLWGVVGFVIVYGLLRRLTWAPWLTRLGCLAYLLVYWIDRMFLANPLSRDTNILFVSAVSVVILIWVFWLFSRRKVKLYFGETHER